MCGISGYFNGIGAVKKVFQVLLNQQDRGTDATGIAYLSNKRIHIIKKAVSPQKFQETVDNINDEDVYVAIGHNRHATSNTLEKHLDEESHPFFSEDRSFALVHNGTVLHEDIIRKLLQIKDNHNFSSKVDSEVYVHILEDILKTEPSRIKAIEKLYKLINGNMLILFSDGELIGIPSIAFIVAQEKDTILIASGEESIIPLLGNRFQLATPKTGTKPKAISIKLKDDDKLDVIFYGDWEINELELPKGFIAAIIAECDFCGDTNVYCEKYQYSKDVIKNRCIKCFKKKVIKLPEVVTSSLVSASYTPSIRKKSPKKKSYIICSGYKHSTATHKVLYCCYCKKYYCKGCFRDARRHNCVAKHPELTGYKTFPKDVEWDLFA